MWSNFFASSFPQLLNQAPSDAQQLRLPLLKAPHLGHALLGLGVVVLTGAVLIGGLVTEHMGNGRRELHIVCVVIKQALKGKRKRKGEREHNGHKIRVCLKVLFLR